MIQVVNAGSDPQISIYDAHTAAWTRIDNLALTTDPCPLSGRNRQGLEAALARRLAASFQKPIPPGTEGVANGLRSVLTNRFSAPRTTPDVDFF